MLSGKRSLRTDEIEDYEKALAFDRFTVHQVTPETRQHIAKIRAAIDGQEDRKAYKNLNKQLSIYFAFCMRDAALAIFYAEKYYPHLSHTTHLEEAQALSVTAYAKTIDPLFQDTSDFDTILALIAEQEVLDDKTQSVEINLLKFFALQYKALLLQRQCFSTQFKACVKTQMRKQFFASLHIHNAITGLENLLQAQAADVLYLPAIQLQLAEAKYISAAIFSTLSHNDHPDNHSKNAQKFFDELTKMVEDFCDEKHAPHFLLAAILQSNAQLLCRAGQYESAIIKLSEAHIVQITIYQTACHMDVAEVWHDKAIIYAAQKKYILATEAHRHALKIKVSLADRHFASIRISEMALLEAIRHIGLTDIAESIKQINQAIEILLKVPVEFDSKRVAPDYFIQELKFLRDQYTSRLPHHSVLYAKLKKFNSDSKINLAIANNTLSTFNSTPAFHS